MFVWWLQRARNSWYTVQGEAMHASYPVGCHRRFANIAQGFDWFFH